MKKRGRVVALVAFLAALEALNRAVTGSFQLPTGDASLWLHGGLLLIVLGSYWTEPFFTRPADVVVNSLVVFVSLSMLTNPPFSWWWSALRYEALALFVVTNALIWATPRPSAITEHAFTRLTYHIVTRLGSASVLFSSVFILTLLSYFDLNKPAPRWMVVMWGVLLLVREIDLSGLLRHIVGFRTTPSSVVGTLCGFVTPNIVRFEVANNARCPRGAIVAFTASGQIDSDSPIGIVVAHRVSPTSVEAEVILIESTFKEGALDKRGTVTAVATPSQYLSQNELYKDATALVGFACSGTDIGRLRIELVSRPPIQEGYLVAVPIGPNEPRLLFQLTTGTITKETAIGGNERAYTIAEAQQLGNWMEHRKGFATYSWVVPENAPVFSVTERGEHAALSDGEVVTIGAVPNSPYLVNVSLPDLVLFHCAILGVTGSGKSFLAYQLIEQAAATGVRVLCLDITGDYKRFLRGAVLLKTMPSVRAFLDTNDAPRIGIIEFTEKTHPIRTTSSITDVALKWCEEHRTAEEIQQPVAKVLLVLEEAHTVVPEWNFNSARDLQDIVNKTAQNMLQARKYGLGFLVITQRTANVTKSVLNQCNTMFAFQAYDETGFDFMKNYMGESHVKALPNLKKRHAVVVGKASRSDRPVIVELLNQNREPAAADIAEWNPPVLPAPPGRP